MKGKTLNQKLAARATAAAGAAFDILSLTAQLADGDTVTINGVTYEADDDSTITDGNIAVDITGNGNEAADVDDLVTAILANQGDSLRVVDLGDEIAIIARPGGTLDVSDAGTSTVWLASGAAGAGYPGTNPFEDVNIPAMQSRAAIASEVTIGYIPFAFGKTPTGAIAQVRTAAGVVKAWDGAITINGELVLLNNAGSVDWAATDIVTVLATF